MTNKYNPELTNSPSEQQKRLISYLRKNKRITTLEARLQLDIMHPAGRIKELREKGYKILTNWQVVKNSKNVIHRIAEYVLVCGNY